jgi:methylmalonyl-CoA/ethylmalonyl-CoA epimerase
MVSQNKKKEASMEAGKHIGRALHIGISVFNMEESLEWYEKNLGFTLKKDLYVPPLGSRICFIEKDGLEIELFQYDHPKHMPEDHLVPDTNIQTVGTKHVAFETDNMEALKKIFQTNGVDIAHEVAMEGDSVMFIRDNSGILIEIIEPDSK